MIAPYDKQVEHTMRTLYERLSEKNRRQYAAVEALKLPYGGISTMARLFGCSRDTIRRGIRELGAADYLPRGRNRRPRCGRKRTLDTLPGLDTLFLAILRDHTAGGPQKPDVKWTDLRVTEITKRLHQAGMKVSRKIVKQLLQKHRYVKRKALKKTAIGKCEGRNEQFENIAQLKADCQAAGNPLISVDTKKREHLGKLFRAGALYTRQPLEVYDHDFPHLAEGVALPHTIYDVTRNSAYVNIGTTHDTSEFACDSIRRWWSRRGRYDYPQATSILLLVDAGGSNAYRQYLFKQDLQKLADKIGIEIRVAHYPPYASKWNPVEHRVFPHLTRSLQGVILIDHKMVKELVEKTTTTTGLKVRASILNKFYQTGRKVVVHPRNRIGTS